MPNGNETTWLRSSHPISNSKRRVERSVFIAPEVSLGTQTGRRPHRDQDVLFKITYRGSRSEARASYIMAAPSWHDQWADSPVRMAAHQERDAAIVLYELDMARSDRVGYLRLVIDPVSRRYRDPTPMVETLLIDGEPCDRQSRQLSPGTILAWRVGDAAVVLRLLDAWGVTDRQATETSPVMYTLHVVDEVGLCLDCPLTAGLAGPIATPNLSAGFVVRVGSLAELGSPADATKQAGQWQVIDRTQGATRDITWHDAGRQLRLVWDQATNRAVRRETNGQVCPPHPRYDSPLIKLTPGEVPTILAP